MQQVSKNQTFAPLTCQITVEVCFTLSLGFKATFFVWVCNFFSLWIVIFVIDNYIVLRSVRSLFSLKDGGYSWKSHFVGCFIDQSRTFGNSSWYEIFWVSSQRLIFRTSEKYIKGIIELSIKSLSCSLLTLQVHLSICFGKSLLSGSPGSFKF